MIREKHFYGWAIFYDTARAIVGMTELPANFVALKDNKIVIIGEPGADVLQLALAHAGFTRLATQRVRAGECSPGLLLDIAA